MIADQRTTCREARTEWRAPVGEALLELLAVVHESTLHPDAYLRIMRALAPVFGTSKCLYVRVDRTFPRESVTEVIGLAPEHVSALRARDLEQDFIWNAVVTLPQGSVFRTTELLPIDVLHQGPLYEQIAVPAGVEYAMGAIIENTPEFFADLCFMQAGHDFTDAQKALLGLLLPHLQTAARISRRIASGDAGRREALLSFDRARQPVVVLDRSGYAIYSNPRADRILAQADGVTLKFGRFLFQNIATQAEFERRVRLAVARPEPGVPVAPQEVRVSRVGPGTPYGITVVALAGSADRAVLPDGAACMVMIHDLDLPSRLPIERVVWLYRLTRAEARVCECIFRVGSVDAVAEELNLTRNTVRSHLKSIYAKVGVSTMSQLMQRLANSVRMSDALDEPPVRVSGPPQAS